MNFLITAGPTREPLDPVRYLSNRSSGKMGYAIARAALAAGHKAVLVSGPVALRAPEGATAIFVNTAAEMLEAVDAQVDAADVVVMCAAVSDFRPIHVEPRKIKKGNRDALLLELEPTRDILGSLRDRAFPAGRPLVIGFAAETENVAAGAQRKLNEKGCDVIAANDVSRPGIGFDSDDNEITLYFRSGISRMLARTSKDSLAKKLVEIFTEMKKGFDVSEKC